MFVLNRLLIPAVFLLTVALSSARGQDYRVELIVTAPSSEKISKELIGEFSDQGIRIRRGAKRSVCEVWFCKQWSVEPEFKSSD